MIAQQRQSTVSRLLIFTALAICLAGDVAARDPKLLREGAGLSNERRLLKYKELNPADIDEYFKHKESAPSKSPFDQHPQPSEEDRQSSQAKSNTKSGPIITKENEVEMKILIVLLAFFGCLLLFVLACVLLYCWKEHVKENQMKERDDLLLLQQKEEYMLEVHRQMQQDEQTTDRSRSPVSNIRLVKNVPAVDKMMKADLNSGYIEQKPLNPATTPKSEIAQVDKQTIQLTNLKTGEKMTILNSGVDEDKDQISLQERKNSITRVWGLSTKEQPNARRTSISNGSSHKRSASNIRKRSVSRNSSQKRRQRSKSPKPSISNTSAQKQSQVMYKGQLIGGPSPQREPVHGGQTFDQFKSSFLSQPSSVPSTNFNSMPPQNNNVDILEQYQQRQTSHFGGTINEEMGRESASNKLQNSLLPAAVDEVDDSKKYNEPPTQRTAADNEDLAHPNYLM